MIERRHLSRAPIREAILDLGVPENPAVDLSELGAVLQGLGDFSEIQELRRGSITFHFSVEGEARSQVDGGEPYGVRGVSNDGLWVAQFKLDGLTFSRLSPYTNWEDFAETARPFVTAFLGVVDPPRVERLALRYINHFRLPYPGDVEDYFVGLITIPPALPQFTSNLLSRVTIHDPERDFSA